MRLTLLSFIFSFVSNFVVAQKTIIKNVNVVGMMSGKILPNQNLIIDDGLIAYLGNNTPDLNDVDQTIDGQDKYIMPGLAEMHAHIPPPTSSKQRIEDVLFLYLSNGVTLIRGMLGDSSHLILREQALEGNLLSPRIFTSSPSLNGNSVTSTEEAIQKVTKYKKEGYDFLKIHPGIKREVFDQVVSTANEVGIDFAGHVPVDVGIKHALKSGYASIDHVDGFLEGLVPEAKEVNPEENGFFGYNFAPLADPVKIPDLIALSKEHEVWIVPTQSLFERWFAPISAEELLSQEEMQYMPASTRRNWLRVKNQYTEDPNFTEEQWMIFDKLRRVLIKQLQENGHGLLMGSDAPQLFNVPGFSIHHEIDGMQNAGLSNLEILRSGTLNPAKFFNLQDKIGQVKVGFEADLILIDDNPIENLDALQQLSGVFIGGKWLSKSEIDQRLNEISERCLNE